MEKMNEDTLVFDTKELDQYCVMRYSEDHKIEFQDIPEKLEVTLEDAIEYGFLQPMNDWTICH